MKYLVFLVDGAADYKIKSLGNKTPLQVANKPNIDFLAAHGEVGMVNTIPAGMPAGSDVANLSVMGYDPARYHTGRSPLEAVSMGVELQSSDVTFRCNLVNLSGGPSYSQRVMVDHSAGEITTGEAREIIRSVAKKLGTESIRFYPGMSYRHIMVWQNGPDNFRLTPPHDILGKKISSYLPKGENASILKDLMHESIEILEGHPVNKKRKQQGLREANSIWIWGQGRLPRLEPFYEKFGIHGSVISAVDLIKGIGICAGLKPIDVEGATGNINTNFSGKAEAAMEGLKKTDFLYLHVEAPDECSHQGNVGCKIKAIEIIDREIIGPVFRFLKNLGQDFKIMVLPDHPTPISARTHSRDPVPFLIYSGGDIKDSPANVFDEFYPQKNGKIVEKGYTLLNYFLAGS
ncbi:MAG: cofactor-independent phosphoglycerate mutase [Actinomycetota bacterium]